MLFFQAYDHFWYGIRDRLIGDITLVRFWPPVRVRYSLFAVKILTFIFCWDGQYSDMFCVIF